MQGSSDLLWEDLGIVNQKAYQSYEMLQAILNKINEGTIGQPSRMDSQHLNRLMVLADLLYAELRTWAEDLAPESGIPGYRQNGNGTH